MINFYFVVQKPVVEFNYAFKGTDFIPNNLITEWCPKAEWVDLSHNAFKNLLFVTHFHRLRHLNLDNNLIDHNSVFPNQARLCSLSLAGNKVGSNCR